MLVAEIPRRPSVFENYGDELKTYLSEHDHLLLQSQRDGLDFVSVRI